MFYVAHLQRAAAFIAQVYKPKCCYSSSKERQHSVSGVMDAVPALQRGLRKSRTISYKYSEVECSSRQEPLI